ncbi:MAG: hypothetical protein SGI77_05790, partial [Pirellulaceae bacterium]|nr:hypothetical protein [Pirellulaceae bacterium]
MKNLTKRIASALSSFLKKRHRELRRKAFESHLHWTFRRLEPRRVLSVNATLFPGGVLDITFLDDVFSTSGALLANGANFFVDTDNSGAQNGAEIGGLLNSLNQITVNGAAGVGAFAWRGDFSLSNGLQSLMVQNVNTATIAATATLQTDATIGALSTISFGGNMTVNNNLVASVTANNGQISDVANASLHVVGNADLSGNGINLGSAANDNIQFGSLTVHSDGTVQIAEDTSVTDLTPGTRITGINTAGTFDLTSSGTIEFSAGSTFNAISTILGHADGINSDVLVNGVITSTSGNVTLEAPDSIVFGAVGSINVMNNGNIVLTANMDALDGDGTDGILMNDGSLAQVAGGTIRLEAQNAFAGDITLGQLIANTNNGVAINILAANNIADGTAAETASLQAANGTIQLTSANVGIGAGLAVADIDIDARFLTFNAPGVVQITDLVGGLTVNGSSTAGGGGFLAANSPLTISANIVAGASMIFTAGDGALAGDDLTINNNAVVSLAAAALGTLTFNAGDDIIFATGTIVTNVAAGRSVVLNADREELGGGEGALDGDRGQISEDGNVATIEVTTNALIARAGDGISLDTEVASLDASNSTAGAIAIREQSAINLNPVINRNGAINVTAQGTITAVNVDSTGTDTDTNDITLVSLAGDVRVGLVQAGPTLGDVIITAQSNIIDNDIGIDDLDIRGNNVTLTATTGNIGATSSDVFRENVDLLEIVATAIPGDPGNPGNLVANALTGFVAIDADVTGTTMITATTGWVQSNGDINAVGGVYMVTNLALIADADNNGVGTVNLDTNLTVVGDLRVEGADITAVGVSINLFANRLMVYSGQSETFNVTTTQLDATTNGDLIVTATGSVELIDLSTPYFRDHGPVGSPLIDRDNVALQSLSSNGNILLNAKGTITVTDDVIAGDYRVQTNTGTITLNAEADVVITDTILSYLGSITITAFHDIAVGGPISPYEVGDTDNLAVISTISGNITLQADADGTLSGAGGSITMLDGTRVIAGRDATALYIPGLEGNPSPSTITLGAVSQLAGFAEIRLLADGAITLGSLQSTNTGNNAILVQSLNGAIIDSGDATSDANLIANLPNAVVTLRSVLGMGDTNPLETNAFQLNAFNRVGVAPGSVLAAGSIRIQETPAGGDLILLDPLSPDAIRNDAAAGDIQIQVDNGNLVSNGFVQNQNGNILIQTLAANGDIIVQAQILSMTGDVNLRASDDVFINSDLLPLATQPIIGTSGPGTIYVLSQNNTNDVANGVTMTPPTLIDAGTGQVRVVSQNNSDILLGRINAASVSLIADRSIIDNNDTLAVNTLNIQAD